MSQDRSIDILDLIITILKRKKLLFIITTVTFILSYLAIYIFIDEEYESTALIVPSGESTLSGFSGLMKNLKDIPLGLGGKSKSSETDFFTTIIYSRTSLENLISKFDLQKDYNEESLNKTIKKLKDNIDAGLNTDDAYEIKLRASSPSKAADMVNYLLDYLNKTVIEYNVSKSRDNRIFIEQRYSEIISDLRKAEDSLQFYQEKSGLIEAEQQLKLILSAYSELETNMIENQLKLSLFENFYPKNSPHLELLKNQVELYRTEIKNLKSKGRENSLFLPYQSLPQKAKSFLRYYRDVEIYKTILEFIAPLYEQAKFEEQKNIPILQVIDRGRAPEKKSYPPRTVFSILFTFTMLILVIIGIVIKESFQNSQNVKVKVIAEHLSIRRKK